MNNFRHTKIVLKLWSNFIKRRSKPQLPFYFSYYPTFNASCILPFKKNLLSLNVLKSSAFSTNKMENLHAAIWTGTNSCLFMITIITFDR